MARDAVADGEAAALGSAGADVAGGHHAGAGGFQVAGRALERPQLVGSEHGAGQDIAFGVQADALRQPFGVRLGADEHEHGGAAQVVGLARAIVAQPHALDGPVAFDAVELLVLEHFDPALSGEHVDAFAEIFRHALAQIVAANDDLHLLGALRQKHCGLAGRVAAADNDGCGIAANARLDGGGCVVHAGTGQAIATFDIELPVAQSRGHQQAARAGHLTGTQAQVMFAVGGTVDRLHADRRRELGAELERLQVAEIGQLGAADARGKADEVFDSGAAASLAPGTDGVDDQSF